MSKDPSRQRRTRDELDHELEQLLTDAEETAARLRRELEAKRAERAASAAAEQAQLEFDQHAEIDRLEEHLAASRLRWAEVRGFLEEALREAGRGHDGDEPDDREG